MTNIKFFKGFIKKTSRKYGFLKIKNNKDLFIPEKEMESVFFGDFVTVCLNQDIVKIISIDETNSKNLIGIFVESINGNYIVPDAENTLSNLKIQVPESLKHGARHDQYVKFCIVEHPFQNKKPTAEILEIIGGKNSYGIESSYNMAKYNVSESISDKTLLNSELLLKQFDQKINKRKDLTKLDFITIDGEYACDLDDAIYVQKLKNKWKLLVAIADVSELVTEGDLDDHAYNRASTVYMLNRVVPMLPQSITKRLSLNPKQKKNVLVADMTLDCNGKVVNFNFYEAVIESKIKLSYKDVNNFLNKDCCDDEILLDYKIKTILSNVNELYCKIKKSKKITNSRTDYRNIMTPYKKICKIVKMGESVSNRMVEEMMLMANQSASKFLSLHLKSGFYKSQNGIKANKLNDVYFFLSKYINFDIDMLRTFSGFNHVIQLINQCANSKMLQEFIDLNLEKSYFSENAKEHLSMGCGCYTYFTSPLRRYSDIIVHRMIKSKINKKKYVEMHIDSVKVLDKKVKKNQRCESDVLKWLQYDYSKRELRNKKNKAIITGVNKDYFEIKLVDTGVEGILTFPKNRDYKSKYFNAVVQNKTFSILDCVYVNIRKKKSSKKTIFFEF